MADLREPKSILDHPTLTSTLDLSQPVAVMLVAVLMYFRDTDDPNPFEMVATLLERDAVRQLPGHHPPHGRLQPRGDGRSRRRRRAAGVTLVPRSQAEIEGSSPAWTWSTPG